MTTRESLDKMLAALQEEQLKHVLDYTEFLQWSLEWNLEAAASFEKCYSPNEPDYTEADIKREHQP
jgi:hypothetical protein